MSSQPSSSSWIGWFLVLVVVFSILGIVVAIYYLSKENYKTTCFEKSQCGQCTKPPGEFKIFAYYQNWGSCYTSYNKSSAGEPKPDVFSKVLSLGVDELAFAFCLLSNANVGGPPTPLSSYLLYSGVPGNNLASFESGTIFSDQIPFQALQSSFVQPIRTAKKTPFIGLGGWSDNTDFGLPLPPGISSWKSVGTTIAKLCNALPCGLVLDFEHLSQDGFSPREKQLPNFVSMIQGIKETLDPSLPFYFCTRFNACLPKDSLPPTQPVNPYDSDNELSDILQYLGKSCREVFDGVQIMAYDDPSRMIYENIILNFQKAGVEPSLLYMGAEIGRQEASGSWPGVEDDLLLIQAVQKYQCRGVMMWAINPSSEFTGDPDEKRRKCAYYTAPAMLSFYQKSLQGQTLPIHPCSGKEDACNANAPIVQTYDPSFPDQLQCPPPVDWPYSGFASSCPS